MSDYNPTSSTPPTPDAPPPRNLGPNPPVYKAYREEKPETPVSDVAKEVRAEEVSVESPEGRPADPAIGSRGLKAMVLIVAAAVMVAAVLVGILVSVGLGLAIAGMGIVFLLVNPIVGAAMMRSKERERVEDRHSGAPLPR